jgi:hypothetical protein
MDMSALSGGFAGQSWIKWVAFVVLLMTVLLAWNWVINRVFE